MKRYRNRLYKEDYQRTSIGKNFQSGIELPAGLCLMEVLLFVAINYDLRLSGSSG